MRFEPPPLPINPLITLGEFGVAAVVEEGRA